MRIGFLTGSITRIGSGRAEAVPLSRAFSKLGCEVYGLQTTRFKQTRTRVENLDVCLEPLLPYLAPRPLGVMRTLIRRPRSSNPAAYKNGLGPFDLATGDALLSLRNKLNLDVLYTFHNTNVARILRGWPHPSCILAINLIGFGIDPSRGGVVDTFPLQKLIFEHPYWDVHVAATAFELEQYYEVYERLGIPSGKLIYLPHSYDEELFKLDKSSDNDKPGLNRGQKTLLYPVNVYPRKNIELAIDVLSVVNQTVKCKLIVTGNIWDKAYHTRLLEYAHRQGIYDKVEFLGGVEVERLVQLYQKADATIYTSHQETFGLGIIESFGCGTPVVGPDWIIPCREILTASPGGWAAEKNRNRFAEAILDAFQVGNERADFATFARKQYGNMEVAARFLERCNAIKDEKDWYGSKLGTINWKGLYRDAGNLL